MTSRRQFLASLFAALIAAPLIKLGWMKAAPPEGISIRYIGCYDISQDRFVTRMDVLSGFASINYTASVVS